MSARYPGSRAKKGGAGRLFGRTAGELSVFPQDILASSTEYSIIGKDLEGKILLWNEGAHRLYGYEPEEVVGKANSSILHTPDDVRAGKHNEIIRAALRDGKWEGIIQRVRKDGQHFTARVVITPRRDDSGKPIGFLLISKDVSEEIRLTEELKATLCYTRSLIESNIDALMTTDPVGVISDVNREMETLTGCTRDELIGSRFKNYFTDPERAEEGIRRALTEGKVTNYELTALSKDGRITVVSYNASTFRDAAGKLQGVFAAARDITEQKKLEQQLHESQTHTRGLIEASIDGLISVDSTGNISDVNEQMCRMSGYPRQELIGSAFAKYFVDSELATAGVNETFSKGVVTNYVLTLAKRDGTKLRISFNASVFKDPSGSVRGIFAAVRDITDPKHLEGQLQASQFYIRSLIEVNIDALMTTDPLGIITDVNQQMAAMTGYTCEDLIGSPFKKYFTNPQRAEEGIRMVLSQGKVTNYELTAKSKTGRETVVSYNAVTFNDAGGDLQGVFAAARDITEQKRLEEQLRRRSEELEEQNRRVQEANRFKSEFLANISHELRTPLNGIIGFSQILHDGKAGAVAPTQKEYLGDILTSSKHLLQLINDVLDLAKVESGKMEFLPVSVNLEKLVGEVREMVRLFRGLQEGLARLG